ncbi:hypothetical protein [Candidatus Synchoanobacter obligatus]|uniref:Uncharacterized protein n=1 Tax=Candidatus Synchoanobacter obligatus TaxID=2919597 RepID=A0ABT1L392_9GAMM|nr:hypothetical protein [Candidatus Synchoanobacter obligatus]MCP8351712.1 hypothetical protein [Candidatus Synchoanobacter obligatus]
MFKLLRLELSRVRFYLPSILAFLMMVAMFMLIVQQISQQDQKVWGYLPWIALVANRWYHAYMLPGWLRLVGKHEDYYALLTKSYVMMSLVLNMPLAFILSSNTSWVSLLVCWVVLDIMGFLLHCVTSLVSQGAGVLVVYLMLLPLLYPWMVFASMALMGQLVMVKLLFGVWILQYTLGAYLYDLCFKVGEIRE